MTHPDRRAVVLLSGGLDSATTLAIAKTHGYECHALTLQYGQRHATETACARQIAAAWGVVRHLVMDLDLRSIGGSALTADWPVPKHARVEDIAEGIPATYVPARNTIFLSIALAWAEVIPARNLFVGVNALDYSGYPDCRPEFVQAFEKLANVATRTGADGHRIRVQAPLLRWSKAQIIARGRELGVDYGCTTSCYDPFPDGAACGRCDACLLRRRGFEENNLVDPIRYGA